MNLFVNILKDLVTMEKNAPKILAILSKDVFTPTLFPQNAHKKHNVMKMEIASDGDSLKNLERNAKKLFVTENLVLVLQFVKKEIVLLKKNVLQTVFLRMLASLHLAKRTLKETTSANVLPKLPVMMEIHVPLILANQKPENAATLLSPHQNAVFLLLHQRKNAKIANQRMLVKQLDVIPKL